MKKIGKKQIRHMALASSRIEGYPDKINRDLKKQAKKILSKIK